MRNGILSGFVKGIITFEEPNPDHDHASILGNEIVDFVQGVTLIGGEGHIVRDNRLDFGRILGNTGIAVFTVAAANAQIVGNIVTGDGVGTGILDSSLRGVSATGGGNVDGGATRGAANRFSHPLPLSA